ncbi:MAG: hypothetical protein KDA85_01250, partial [Planctomycetaceae bacterium]|nr:hypothetical protein [Planctomycetaceae bacterium]
MSETIAETRPERTDDVTVRQWARTVSWGLLLFATGPIATLLTMRISLNLSMIFAVFLPIVMGFFLAARTGMTSLIPAGMVACVAGILFFSTSHRELELSGGPFLQAVEPADTPEMHAATRLQIERAILRRDLAGTASYTVTDAKGQSHTSHTWTAIPLVSTEWRSSDPVVAWLNESHASGFESKDDHAAPQPNIGLVVIRDMERT